jgi:hypothetical protein
VAKDETKQQKAFKPTQPTTPSTPTVVPTATPPVGAPTGRTWRCQIGCGFTAASLGELMRHYREQPQHRPVHDEPAAPTKAEKSALKFCPCCGVNLAPLRAAIELA